MKNFEKLKDIKQGSLYAVYLYPFDKIRFALEKDGNIKHVGIKTLIQIIKGL